MFVLCGTARNHRGDAIATARRWSPVLWLAVALLMVTVLPVSAETRFVDEASMRLDGAAFADVIDPSLAWFDRLPATPLRAGHAERGFDTVYTLSHQIPVGDGRRLFVTEHFTLGSWLTWPHRSVLFLSGSAFKGNHHSIPVEGYNGTAMAARRGFFAFTVDYLGVGESTRPVDGLEATFEANQDALEVLLRYIRFFRAVPKIDLVGAGYGGSLATQMAADATRVRSCVLSAMLYDRLIGGPLTDPAFVAALENAPDGYFFVPGEGSAVFLTEAPPSRTGLCLRDPGRLLPDPEFSGCRWRASILRSGRGPGAGADSLRRERHRGRSRWGRSAGAGLWTRWRDPGLPSGRRTCAPHRLTGDCRLVLGQSLRFSRSATLSRKALAPRPVSGRVRTGGRCSFDRPSDVFGNDFVAAAGRVDRPTLVTADP